MIGVLTGFNHLMPYTRPAMLKNIVVKNDRAAKGSEYRPRPRCNGRSVLITISRPMGVILNPTSSATGAYATLANSSSGVVAGRLPTDTPDEFKSIDSRTVTIRRLELRSGMTTNQSGVDVGFDFLVRDFKLEMIPPRA